MTALQKIELDLLKEFIQICDKLKLTYYLVCGSCLGAVKYQGFIPWDDDIDVAMERNDYEKFCAEAPQYLSSGVFLQNYKSNIKTPFLFSKLRNSNTTYIEKSIEHLPINHGVYIDIFPLDGYPKKKIKFFEVKKKRLRLQIACVYTYKVKASTNLFLKILRLLGYEKRTHKTNTKLEKLFTSYPTDDSAFWCNHGNWQGKLEYTTREQYGNGTWATFEGLRVRIPERYDEYLTQKYGDWRADLPEDQKFGHHFAEIIDLNRPYTDYIEHLPNGKIRVKKL